MVLLLIINSSLHYFFLNGSFLTINSNTGPVGDEGAMGSSGEEGAAGLVGEQGDSGLPGLDGAQGALGYQGDEGVFGPQGDLGEKGMVGEYITHPACRGFNNIYAFKITKSNITMS